MLCLFHFSCPQRHRWEVESGDSLDADLVSSPCPICSSQGEPRIPSEPMEGAELEDELPPPPSRLENPTASTSGKTLSIPQ